MISTAYIFQSKLTSNKSLITKIKLNFDELIPDDLMLLRPVRELTDNKIRQFNKRFNQRDRCFVAKYNDLIVSYAWVREFGFMYMSSIKKSIPIADNSIWIFDCRTSSEYRGNGIYPWLLTEIMNKYIRNKKNCYIDTLKKNTSSVKGILKARFSLYKKYFLIKTPMRPIRIQFGKNI